MSYKKFLEYKEDNIVLLVLEGSFYSCYGKDAYVMNYLFSFKLSYMNDTVKVSFPKSSLERVTRILETRPVSFKVLNESSFTMHCPNNQYSKFLNNDCYFKDKLLLKLSKLSYQELLSITQDSLKL